MWHAPYQALSYFLRQRKPVDPVTVTARLQPAFSCHNKLNCKAAPAAINRLGALKLTVTVRCSAPADVEQRPVHHLPSVLPARPGNSSAQRRLRVLTLRCRPARSRAFKAFALLAPAALCSRRRGLGRARRRLLCSRRRGLGRARRSERLGRAVEGFESAAPGWPTTQSQDAALGGEGAGTCGENAGEVVDRALLDICGRWTPEL